MSGSTIRISEVKIVQDSLASKLKVARAALGMSTRSVANAISNRLPTSHTTIANYESGKTTPPIDVLAALSHIYDRPLNWFLEYGQSLTEVRYRNLKSRVKAGELHQLEAHAQRWIDAYVAIERRLNRPLSNQIGRIPSQEILAPDALAREIRQQLGLSTIEPVSSMVDILERFGIRVLEESTPLKIDGLAAKYGDENIVVLNPLVSNDRIRLNAAHELAYVLYSISDQDESDSKSMEQKAYEFGSHLLLPNDQLKQAFTGKSMVRLVQFKERFGISLAAMIDRAEKLKFLTKSEVQSLWIEFTRRGWRSDEPGCVRPDRATRFEQLIEEAYRCGKMSLKEIADLAGVRPSEINDRVDFAMGSSISTALMENEANIFKFPQ